VGGEFGPRLGAFRPLAGNEALARVIAAYALFILTEYAVWIAMLFLPTTEPVPTIAGLFDSRPRRRSGPMRKQGRPLRRQVLGRSTFAP
jgi:hypothetical protein